MNSLQGHLLVASPHFVGAPLPRSVVLLINHTGSGASGVVLNDHINGRLLSFCQELRRQGKTPQAALEMFQPPKLESPELQSAEADFPAETGEHPPLPAASPLANVPVGVLVGPAPPTERRGGSSLPSFRVIVGTIGWNAGRLEAELAQGLWLETPATADLLFDEHSDLWRTAVHRVGTGVLYEALGVAPSPAAHLN